MKTKTFLLIFLTLYAKAHAQNKYWVSFKDKAGTEFNPYQYFDERTIEQRRKQNIPLSDSSDFPVNADYLSRVAELSDSISWSSRWLNGVAIYTALDKAKIISDLSFVKNVEEMAGTLHIATIDKETNLDSADLRLLRYQTDRMQGKIFQNNSLDGKGIRIAVFDVGFPGVDKNPAFKKIKDDKRIIATYDFIHKKENVFAGHWHGAATLSCIGGMADSINIGMATGAEFLLARTEKSLTETFSEEENWLAAAEWADKNGVNIISSSLGYTNKRYFNYQMDGHTSLVAKAATIAASKGILVINAAGNDGNNSWHVIDTPGDADSVLTVGGTDPKTDMHIFFSSYGPSSSGKLKPNVSAPAEVIASKENRLAGIAGTSFSTPLVAGFAACAWQAHRQWSNMELFNAIEKSSHLYPYFDYANGFGIPQADKIINEPVLPEPTFDFVIVNNNIKVILREQYSYTETEEALGYESRRNFYYKVEDKDGIIKNYFVLIADRKEMLHVYAEDFKPGDVLTIHFEGYTGTLDFPEENK